MLLKFFADYPYVVYSIITWGFIFAVIRVKGIKRLWPIAIVSAAIIFISVKWLIAVGLYISHITFLPILGIPLFLILWGAGNGIIFAYFFGQKNYQRFLAILGFSAITLWFEHLVEMVNKIEHLGKFSEAHEYLLDVAALSTLAFLMTHLFEHRLKKETINLYPEKR